MTGSISKLPSNMKYKLRLLSHSPINITFHTRTNFINRIDSLKSCLVSVIFSLGDHLLTTSKHTSNSFVNQCGAANSDWPTAEVLFSYDLDSTTKFAPTIQVLSTNQKHSLRLYFDVLHHRGGDDLDLHSVLCKDLESYLDLYVEAVLNYWDTHGRPPKSFKAHHYAVEHSDGLSTQLVIIFYAKQVFEEVEKSLRTEYHAKLNLPLTSPLFRRGQAMLPVPYLTSWLGPNDNLLVCPHTHLNLLTNGSVYVVEGRYSYKHYLQDGMDDKNWGCAYRSLQTLISWLMWQGEIQAKRLPSLHDIQSSLVRVKDKPKSFIGSRQWIGSLEVSFCLQELYNVQCRLLPVPKGSQMASLAAPQLAEHFVAGGGPVMVGGGQLAHTIIGIYFPNRPTDYDPTKPISPRFLILDPHFIGPSGQIKPVLDKGWCGWKESSFWKPDVHYNLCFLPPIHRGQM